LPQPLLGIGGPLSTAVIIIALPPAPVEPPLLELPAFATPLSLAVLPPPVEPVVIDPAVPLEAPPDPPLVLVLSPPAPVGSTVVSSPVSDWLPLPALQAETDRSKAQASIKKKRMMSLMGWFSQGDRSQAPQVIHGSVWGYPSLR
jgi:hypothetical protein